MSGNFLGHRGRLSLWIILTCAFALSGCNILGTLHRDGVESNANVLTADGKAALGRGDYNNALEYFRLAVEHDPRNSDARLGYAEALLKSQHFDLGTFFNYLQTDSSAPTQNLLMPADWGCADFTELVALFSTLVNVLDPIAQGLTRGPTPSNDMTLNLNVGLFYVLRMAARVQETAATTFEIQKFTKDTPEALALGIDPVIYNQLPQDFYWITNAPPSSLLTQVQADVDTGVLRLQTAAANSSANARQMVENIIDLFSSLQLQAHSVI